MNARTIYILFKREMMSFFYSPIAYVVAFFYLVYLGLCFSLAVSLLNTTPSQYSVMETFLALFPTWFAQVLIMPVLTMRSFSEEYRLGTFEGLMTAPVRDWEVVLAKFLGVMAFYITLWIPTLLFPICFKLITLNNTPVSSGPIWCGYLLILLSGMFYGSIGLLISSMTRNQIISAVVSLASTCGFFSLGFLQYMMNLPKPIEDLANYISSFEHASKLSAGLIDTRIFVFYITVTAMLLTVTHRIVESRRWRA